MGYIRYFNILKEFKREIVERSILIEFKEVKLIILLLFFKLKLFVVENGGISEILGLVSEMYLLVMILLIVCICMVMFCVCL